MPRFTTPRVAPQLAPGAMAYAPQLSQGIMRGVLERNRKKEEGRRQGESERANLQREEQGRAQIAQRERELGDAQARFDATMKQTEEHFGRTMDWCSAEARMSQEEADRNRVFQATQAGLNRGVQREGIAAGLMKEQMGQNLLDLGNGSFIPQDTATDLLYRFGQIAGADMFAPIDPRARATANQAITLLGPALMSKYGVPMDGVPSEVPVNPQPGPAQRFLPPRGQGRGVLRPQFFPRR